MPALAPFGVGILMNTIERLLSATSPHRHGAWPDIFPDHFVATAKKEGLAEQLYFYHQHEITDTVVLEACKTEYIATLSRNMLFGEQLGDLATLLKNWPCILLKGIYLIQRVYPDAGLRRFSDIDILVHPEDLPAIDRTLLRAGYRRDHALDVATLMQSTALNSVMYRPPEHGRAPLHVHWHLFNSILPKYRAARLDMDALWARATLWSDGLSGLSDIDLLIHLCEHAVRHSCCKWILIRDIAQVLSGSPALDTERFCATVKHYGLTQPVRCALELVRMDNPDPRLEPILDTLSMPAPGSGERLFTRLACRGYRHPELCNLLYWSAQPGLPAKIHYLYRALFPERSVLATAYGVSPKEITPATYAARLGRGLRYMRK
ncbi:MAG: hypothetical protein EOM20_14250 [Spartobacteria bacterium]|nr:hypothetical protein [Spartobacteria bacterium]